MNHFIHNVPTTEGVPTEEGALYRLVSDVKTLIQGAAPEALARLGTERLMALKKEVEREQDAIRATAAQVKAAINSSLSVDELTRLGTKKLLEVGAPLGVKVAPSDEWASYDCNAFLDEAAKGR